jgi:class 3 adenylate cyclase
LPPRRISPSIPSFDFSMRMAYKTSESRRVEGTRKEPDRFPWRPEPVTGTIAGVTTTVKGEILNHVNSLNDMPVAGADRPHIAGVGNAETQETLAKKLERKRKLEQEQYRMIVDLYGHYRDGTFLSIDIVNSTKLKEGEDSLKVIQTFQAFHRYIAEHISGSLASVFSGDGVMCLYDAPQKAVDIAINILTGLKRFNKEQSSLRRYLDVRVGINTGTLLLDDVKDLGTIAERDIDIAGHLQKYSRPGELLISASTWEKIANKTDFKKRWQTIDDTVVYKYRRTFSASARRGPSSLSLVRAHGASWGLRMPRLMRSPKIVLSLLTLIVVVSGLLLYSDWKSGLPLPLAAEKVPVVINNQIKNVGQGKYLTEVKIRQGNSLIPLPDAVFLVIPREKNTQYNRKNGIYENIIYPLEKQGDGKYYVTRYGIFALQVEILDDYLIFLTRKDAENHLQGKKQEGRVARSVPGRSSRDRGDGRAADTQFPSAIVGPGAVGSVRE